ncbi:MAG: biotin/lipoyl-binding protein, partial [Gammaproteobacteria bacterium]|nr:biotin/lipoyl-binding protein [Gammaproteobacteria bacterium]
MNMQYLRLSIATLLAGLLVSGCDQSPSPSAQRKPHSQRVAIEIIKPVSTTIERRFNALIIAPNTINISNQIAGTIITMPFRAGSPVSKGDILVELDSSLTKAEHLKSLADLEKASQDLQRIKKLIPRQLASAEQLSAANTE